MSGRCTNALPEATPGLVEIWDTIKPKDKREIEAWDAPFDELTEKSPQVRLAAKIAANVKRWTKQGTRAGDVLILVRQRGPLFEAIIRSLKDAHVPVAGADRLVLTEHIAVMDLMVLADALLLPADDLALATVLKSPLFGLDDEDLFKIAWERKTSLRTALRAKAPMDPRFAQASRQARPLCAMGAQATRRSGSMRAYWGPRGVAKRFLARLGHEADDALDEFLNRALDYERRETPSLQGFHRLAARGQDRHQTRHGDHPRRGAGDDRARCQRPGGTDRHPGRHHDTTCRTGAASTAAASIWRRTALALPAILSGRGRRPTTWRRSRQPASASGARTRTSMDACST